MRKGTKHSEETKEKMKSAQAGRVFTFEHRTKLVKAWRKRLARQKAKAV